MTSELTLGQLKAPLLTLSEELRNTKRIASSIGREVYVGADLIDRWVTLVEAEMLATPDPRTVLAQIAQVARPVDGDAKRGWLLDDASMQLVLRSIRPDPPAHLMRLVKNDSGASTGDTTHASKRR